MSATGRSRISVSAASRCDGLDDDVKTAYGAMPQASSAVASVRQRSGRDMTVSVDGTIPAEAFETAKRTGIAEVMAPGGLTETIDHFTRRSALSR